MAFDKEDRCVLKDENGNIIENRGTKSVDASLDAQKWFDEADADLAPDAGIARNIRGIGKSLFGIFKSIESNYYRGDYDDTINTAKKITKTVATGVANQALNTIEKNAKHNPNMKDPDRALELVDECRDKLDEFKHK